MLVTTLTVTAFLMGIAGGPHCVAMCGAACAGMSRGTSKGLWFFHIGRLFSYATLGFIAASSMQAIGWLSIHAAVLRPVWTMLHLVAMSIGLVLLIRAKQPIFLENSAKQLWRKIGSYRLAPLGMGLVWALMPCSLLYSALIVAGLTAQAIDGILVMLAFAMGSSISLVLGPWLWLRLRNSTAKGQWGVRLAGLTLMLTSAWGLWTGLVHNAAPWCVT